MNFSNLSHTSIRTGIRATRRAVILASVATLFGANLAFAQATLRASDPIPAEVPKDTTLIFGDYYEEVLTALKLSGELEKIPFKVEAANFTSGVESVEALRSGAADLARVGDVPPISAQRSGTIEPIVLAQQGTWGTTKFVINADRGIEKLSDLKGKKIAYSEGTSVALVVQRALLATGLKVSDVTLVEVPLGSNYETLASGAVDAATFGEPNLSKFLAGTPGGHIIDDAQTQELEKQQDLTYLIASPSALANSAKAAALQVFLAHYIRAENWKNTHRDEWIDGYYVANGTARTDAQKIVKEVAPAVFPKLDDTLIARQQANADIFFANGEIPEKIDVSKAFDRRFNDVIVKTVTEIGAKHAW